MAVYYLPCSLTVNFEELDGSPEENFPIDWRGIEVIRTFRCAATDRVQLIREFLGYTTLVGNDVLIYQPNSYYLLSALLVAVSARTKPFGKMSAAVVDNRFADYPFTTIEIVYRTRAAMVEAFGGLCTYSETLQEASEFVTIPTEGLYWGTGGNKEAIDVMDAPGKINHMLELTYNVRGARAVPAGVFNHPGKINDAEVVARNAGIAFPAGTLLCSSPTVNKEVTFSDTVFDITLRFLAKNNGTYGSPKGWNFFPRISAAGANISWERITDGTDNKNFYEEADFSDIIVP